ncbi:MAG TPA: serine/threonine-protein kinase [Kofleriaceae bacterium]|jgi:tetratricopeptide (TPR) repeat protein/predicted Ser/Thr protein kinase
MPCLDDTNILAYFRGELGAPEVAEIETELDQCETCLELMMTVAAAWRADDGALGDQRGPGTKVGRYVIESALGAGAMGVVYAAHDPELDRTIALKVMARPSPALAERFRREAQAMARLDHRNVVPVYDVGGVGPEAFMAMGLIKGVTLREWLREKRTTAQIADAFAQAADGLAAAHTRGIVHRDFKPENVLVGDDGVVRVGDFGLAVLGAGTDLALGSPPVDPTASPPATAAAGTPAYLAPEVRRGQTSGPRADQYSFAVALHEAITGHRPDDKATTIAPRRLAKAVARGLADDPAARFATMADVAAELRAITHTRRRRTVAAVIAGAVAVAAVSAAALAWHARGAADPCERTDLASVWSPGTSAKVRQQLASVPKPYAAFTAATVTAGLDRYAAAWTTSSIGACRATRVDGAQSDDMLDRRNGCLADRRAALAAVVARLQTADASSTAVDLVSALPSIDICDDVTTLAREPVPPRSSAIVPMLAAVRAQLANAKTNFAAGTFDQGVREAAVAVALARTTAHRPLIAEALEVFGGLTVSAGNPEQGLALLDEGLREAESSQAIYAALAIRLREAEVLGTLGKHDEALRVAKLGLATAESAKLDVTAANFEMEIGVLESDAGHNAEALAAYERARPIFEREQGPNGKETGHVIGLIGLVEDDLGKHDDSIRDIKLALDIEGRVYGTAHPNYANELSNLASHIYGTEPQKALELAEQAHAIRVASLDPDHIELAMSWSNLGGIKRSLGKLPEARHDLETALAIKKRIVGADNPSTGVTELNLAQVLLDLKELDAALEHAQRAVTIFVAALGPDHLYTATAQANLGATLIELKRYPEAVAPLEAAIPHLADDSGLHRIQFNLADALSKSGGDPARIRTLAATALEGAKKRDDKVAIEAIEKLQRAR